MLSDSPDEATMTAEQKKERATKKRAIQRALNKKYDTAEDIEKKMILDAYNKKLWSARRLQGMTWKGLKTNRSRM